MLILISCSEGNRTTDTDCRALISLRTDTTGTNIIRAETICKGDTLVSVWPLRYPVYRFDCADVDGDGIADIAVGVIKSTRFDSSVSKRLFLFRLFDGYVRSMWLGSRMAQPLVDFALIKTTNPALIRTVEEEGDGSFLVAEYQWKSFGPVFVRYLKRNISEDEAGKYIRQ